MNRRISWRIRPLAKAHALAAVTVALLCGGAVAQEESFGGPGENPAAKESQPYPTPPGLRRLSPQYDVWIDPVRKRVVVMGEVALREGQLEMFACLKRTKEHESILAANTKAFMVHGGLLAVGAKTGSPAKFEPEYKPPTGTEIEVTLYWVDDKGKQQRARAQEWVRDLKTKKPMTHEFVFAGSGFFRDPDTQKEYYLAEEGDFICVSNFAGAMIDIAARSSSQDAARIFEANSDAIPPVGTPVMMVLEPKVEEQGGE